jgi:hypothetical protein
VAVELAGGGVDDADVEVVDEEQDAGSREGSAEADVVEASDVAKGDTAARSTMSRRSRVAGPTSGRVVGDGGDAVAGQGSVGPLVVVDVHEAVAERLRLVDGVGGRLVVEPALQVASTIEPVKRRRAVTDRASREWSSNQARTSTSLPSASATWVKSACHTSSGWSAAKRM